jgi:hypothetical protein
MVRKTGAKVSAYVNCAGGKIRGRAYTSAKGDNFCEPDTPGSINHSGNHPQRYIGE